MPQWMLGRGTCRRPTVLSGSLSEPAATCTIGWGFNSRLQSLLLMTTRTLSAKKSPLQPNHGSIAPPSGNLLTEAVIGIRLRDHSRQCLSLPQVLAHLSGDDIAAFTGLQAHQTHAWHASLVRS